MTTFKRICIQDWEVTAKNGDHFEVERGKEYITSGEHGDGTVTVFGTFFVPVPRVYFAGEKRFT